MNKENKAKVLQALAVAQDTCFVKENVYKCANDGMVCFNGMIAELINGNRYEFEDIETSVWERVYQAVQDDYVTELWNEKPADVSDEDYQETVNEALDNYEPEIDTYEETVNEMSEYISDDLLQIYDSSDTIQEINEFHYQWINDLIPFDVAMAEVERLIVQQE